MSTIRATLASNLTAIVEQARLAPSVHNTQPWRVKPHEGTLEVAIDRKHALHDGDPTGRETLISLGIFCEAIVIAAGACGLKARGVKLHGKHAVITFTAAKPAAEAPGLLRLLRQRCSDRSIYRSATISQAHIGRLEKSARGLDATVRVVTDKAVLEQIAALTSKGIGLALGSPGFRQELRECLVLPWSSKKRGIALSSLSINPLLAVSQPLLLRLGLGRNAEASLEKRRWLSASAVVIILGHGDLASYWLQAGRAYLRASLAIEDLGLSQATSAAIVEASDYHEDIEAALHTNQRILALIRVGHGGRKHFSPRVDPSELITSS